jgi:hypothetical protein
MSTGPNPILASDNTFIGVTNYAGYTGTGADGAASSLKAASFIPLTTADGTATGQIVLATRAIGTGSAGAGQVQGTAANNAVAVGNPVYVAGIAITGASYAPAYTAGDAAALAVNAVSGRLLTESESHQFTTASTGTPVTANGTAFTLAANEVGNIQNCDDAALYVKLGASASATDFNWVLKAGTAADDGTGGSIRINDWIGVVSIFAATGSPRAAAFKLSA